MGNGDISYPNDVLFNSRTHAWIEDQLNLFPGNEKNIDQNFLASDKNLAIVQTQDIYLLNQDKEVNVPVIQSNTQMDILPLNSLEAYADISEFELENPDSSNVVARDILANCCPIETEIVEEKLVSESNQEIRDSSKVVGYAADVLVDGCCRIETEYVQDKMVSESNKRSSQEIREEELKDKFSDDDDSIKDPDFQSTDENDTSDDEYKDIDAKRKRKSTKTLEEGNRKNQTSKGSTILNQKRKGRTRKERYEAQILRNTGNEYVDEKGKTVKARELKPLIECRMKCKQRFSDEVRQALFEEYWKLGERDKRVNFLSSLICILDKKTIKTKCTSDRLRKFSCKYELNVGNEKLPICKNCFITTFGETNAFINQILVSRQYSVSTIINRDERGRATPKNKWSEEILNEVVTHIQSFPAYESHYCRQTTSKKYLQSDLTLTKMYELYKENRENPVSATIYAKKFHELKLSFKKPQKDTCYKCDLLKIKISCANDEEKESLVLEQKEHHIAAEEAYQSKAKDKQIGRTDTSYAVFAFDLQQCLPTPYLKTSVSFYKRQLWTYNLTVHNLATNQSTCYIWDESVSGRGGNDIASCLYRHIMDLPPTVKNVCFYSDTCGGQNKNSHVAAMFMAVLKEKTTLQCIDHKFLVSGHSHMECDIDHSTIEKAKKKTTMKINHPYDWVQLIRSCKRTNPFLVKVMESNNFLNFSELLKNCFVQKKISETGEKFLWKDLQWARYSRENIGILYYKSSLNIDDTFLSVNFRRRGKQASAISLTKLHNGPVSINKEKKKDLMDLLPLIDKQFHDFYQNLLVAGEVPDVDPDLFEVDPDE